MVMLDHSSPLHHAVPVETPTFAGHGGGDSLRKMSVPAVAMLGFVGSTSAILVSRMALNASNRSGSCFGNKAS